MGSYERYSMFLHIFFYGSYLYFEDMHNTIKNISQMYQFGISEAHK